MNSKIMFLWGLIITIICAALIVLGNIGSDYNLYKLEREIKLSTKKYIEDKNLVPEYNESQVVFVSELIDNDYIKENKDIEKYCIKEVVFTKKLIVNKYEVGKECKVELKSEE